MSQETDGSTEIEGLTKEEKRVINFKEEVQAPLVKENKERETENNDGVFKKLTSFLRKENPVLNLNKDAVDKLLVLTEKDEKKTVQSKVTPQENNSEKKQTKKTEKTETISREEIQSFYDEMEFKKQLCIAAETDTNTPIEVARDKVINTINAYFKDYPDLKECMEALFPNRDIKQCTNKDLINCKSSLIKSVKLRANKGIGNDEEGMEELNSDEPSEREKVIKAAYIIKKKSRMNDYMTNKITEGHSQARSARDVDYPSLMVAAQAERGDVEITRDIRSIFIPYLMKKEAMNVNR